MKAKRKGVPTLKSANSIQYVPSIRTQLLNLSIFSVGATLTNVLEDRVRELLVSQNSSSGLTVTLRDMTRPHSIVDLIGRLTKLSFTRFRLASPRRFCRLSHRCGRLFKRVPGRNWRRHPACPATGAALSEVWPSLPKILCRLNQGNAFCFNALGSAQLMHQQGA